MTIRFQGWKRFLSLGAGVLLCATTGCMSSKEEKRITANPAPLNKPMGPGNTVMTPPTSPAYNNLSGGQTVTSTQTVLPPTASVPSMPMTSGGRPYMQATTVSQPVNTLNNQASFGQTQAPPMPPMTDSRRTSNFASQPQGFNQPQPNYAMPMQQSVPGMPNMQVQPVMPQQNPNMPMSPNQAVMVQQPPVQPAMNVTPPANQMNVQMPTVQMSQQVPTMSGPSLMNNQVPTYNQPSMTQPQAMPPVTQPGTYQNPPQMSVPTGGAPMMMPSNIQGRGAGDSRSGIVQTSAMSISPPPDIASPSMGPSARSIAGGSIKGPNDPSINLPPMPAPVEEAPITVPVTNINR